MLGLNVIIPFAVGVLLLADAALGLGLLRHSTILGVRSGLIAGPLVIAYGVFALLRGGKPGKTGGKKSR
jgi:hypothetical protein